MSWRRNAAQIKILFVQNLKIAESGVGMHRNHKIQFRPELGIKIRSEFRPETEFFGS